jgi:hypothetical protein
MTDVYHICREPVRANRSQPNVGDKFRARKYGDCRRLGEKLQ